ncbi:MAG: helix-hairpin-helix domain-containing protein [Xanthomonadales bacterium]|nr:helix-hairpin-helix domain-containing protein [Xanthomonadales bacterium]
MNPAKVIRSRVAKFTDLPNIGPASAGDFELLGFTQPSQLVGADPWHLYQALCIASGTRQDPCVLDVLMSVTDFLGGAAPRPWWDYTEERKRRYGRPLSAALLATSTEADQAGPVAPTRRPTSPSALPAFISTPADSRKKKLR